MCTCVYVNNVCILVSVHKYLYTCTRACIGVFTSKLHCIIMNMGKSSAHGN